MRREVIRRRRVLVNHHATAVASDGWRVSRWISSRMEEGRRMGDVIAPVAY